MFYCELTADEVKRFDAALGELRAVFKDEIFYGDHLVTFQRNMGFLRDEKFTAAVLDQTRMVSERSMIWRFHVLAWAARQAKFLAGDFVECGVYEGVSTRILATYLEFARIAKKWFLYDLFDNAGGEGEGIVMEHHGPGLYERVRASFAAIENICVVAGRVPDIFAQVVPEHIAFLHLDLNDANAERAALAELFPRIVPGGLIVLDDYGWSTYAAQQASADEFFARYDHHVLELPTGQGLVIKR
jgi:hypothetical protein